MTIMGIDAGEARIGVAMGDDLLRIASPWSIVPAHPEEKALSALKQMTHVERVEKIVIGVPRFPGHPEQQTSQEEKIRAWAERLQSATNIPVVFVDETFSSQLAARWQQDRAQKGKRDDLAAVAILQSYFDALG